MKRDAAESPLRVLVAGTPGSGKSSWARRIGQKFDLPYTELDALFHGPNWTPREEFLDEVRAFANENRWVTEWQYTTARPLLADRATLMLWLDLPVYVAMMQLIRRTVRRRIRREKLWAGNQEVPLRKILIEPNHMIRWGWRTRHDTARRVAELRLSHPHLTVVRVRSHKDAEEWLNTFMPDGGGTTAML